MWKYNVKLAQLIMASEDGVLRQCMVASVLIYDYGTVI